MLDPASETEDLSESNHERSENFEDKENKSKFEKGTNDNDKKLGDQSKSNKKKEKTLRPKIPSVVGENATVSKLDLRVLNASGSSTAVIAKLVIKRVRLKLSDILNQISMLPMPHVTVESKLFCLILVLCRRLISKKNVNGTK